MSRPRDRHNAPREHSPAGHTPGVTSRRYKRRTAGPQTIAGVVFASLVVHVAALYAADQTVLLSRSYDRSLAIKRAQLQESNEKTRAPESPSCEGNAALAAAARAIVCASPLYDRGACLRANIDRMVLGMTICNALALSSEIDLVAPSRVEEIAAEPLLDLLDPAEQAELEAKQEPVAIAQIEQPPPTPPPPPPPPAARKAQVVDLTKPANEQAPDNTHMLSEYDSKVEKQTVARGAIEELVEKPQPAELEKKQNPREASVAELPDTLAEKASDNPDAPRGPGSLVMRKPGESEPAQEAKEKQTVGDRTGAKEPPAGAGLEVARGTADTAQKAQEASAGKTGEGGGGGGRPLVPNLMPTKDVLERAMGGGSVDHLENVESGDTTALNTRRWQYAGFFNRIKLRVRQHWHPAEVFKRRDPNGNVYGNKNRVTRLSVTLDRKGKIRAIVISKKSGVDVLDEEAVRAFRLAQPFPNPPAGLVDPRSGMITFDFGFHFEVNRRDRWKVFKYR